MTITGMVFDIQHASLHDGPDIRTAVFLKGYPLRCIWCHNPKSQAKTSEVTFRPESGSACGECVKTYQHGAHRIVDGIHLYDRSVCVQSGDCVETCQYEALKLAGRPETVECEKRTLRVEESSAGFENNRRGDQTSLVESPACLGM